jgi:hypothetical protein
MLELSGKAGQTKLRGRIEAGFAAPERVRLEALAPFGRPIFILVVNGGSGTLLLPRDKRVLHEASPSAIVEALAGVPLAPDDLRAVVAGCGFSQADAPTGQRFDGGWVSVTAGNSMQWLRQEQGVWRLFASVRPPLEVRYADFVSGRPTTVRLRRASAAADTAVDLTLRLSQVDLNIPLGAEVFQVEVPEDATPLTLDELRRAGPLGAGVSP